MCPAFQKHDRSVFRFCHWEPGRSLKKPGTVPGRKGLVFAFFKNNKIETNGLITGIIYLLKSFSVFFKILSSLHEISGFYLSSFFNPRFFFSKENRVSFRKNNR